MGCRNDCGCPIEQSALLVLGLIVVAALLRNAGALRVGPNARLRSHAAAQTQTHAHAQAVDTSSPPSQEPAPEEITCMQTQHTRQRKRLTTAVDNVLNAQKNLPRTAPGHRKAIGGTVTAIIAQHVQAQLCGMYPLVAIEMRSASAEVAACAQQLPQY
jgi:hypothetical protein